MDEHRANSSSGTVRSTAAASSQETCGRNDDGVYRTWKSDMMIAARLNSFSSRSRTSPMRSTKLSSHDMNFMIPADKKQYTQMQNTSGSGEPGE
jgi:hypothetical protein